MPHPPPTFTARCAYGRAYLILYKALYNPPGSIYPTVNPLLDLSPPFRPSLNSNLQSLLVLFITQDGFICCSQAWLAVAKYLSSHKF